MAGKRPVWRDELYLQTYLLTKTGNSEAKVRQLVGASDVVWSRWKSSRPALREALKRGREARRDEVNGEDEPQPAQTFPEYVYGHLTPELRRLWSEIESLEDDDHEGADAIKALLANSGKRFRQGLFIYALTRSRFNLSEAMRRAMINRRTYESWLTEDKEFDELVREIAYHRKNFFENALMRNVAAGDTQAIIFVNKTQNRDRGYGDRLDVDVSGTINHAHVVLDLAKLELPVATQRAILDQLKAQRNADQTKELDATFTPRLT